MVRGLNFSSTVRAQRNVDSSSDDVSADGSSLVRELGVIVQTASTATASELADYDAF